MITGQTIESAASLAAPATATARPRLLAWRMAGTSAHIPASLVSMVAVSTQLATLLGMGFLADALSPAGGVHWSLVTPASLTTIAFLSAFGLCRRKSLDGAPSGVAAHVLLSVLAAAAVATLALTILGPGPLADRDAAAVWLALTATGLFVARMGLGGLVRRWGAAGRLDRRAVIYGSGAACERVIRGFEADPGCNVTIVGIADDRGRDRAGADVLGYPVIGRLDDAVALARKSRIDTVILSLPVSAEQRILTVLERLSVLPADVCLPDDAGGPTRIGKLPVRALQDTPISGWGLILKAAFDKTIAGLALLLLAPVLAVVAIAVRLDSRGPVLFRQKRYGFNNELIEVYKFRSMYVGDCDPTARRLVTRDDPRVTRVGRFIRKTSLDELPQLLNVLRGELSLVGPRPHAVNAKANDRLYADVVGSYFARHRVRPGITGWAQINGWRGETDTEEKIVRRVEHDLHYIENWSILLDLRILLATPLALIKTDNAY